MSWINYFDAIYVINLLKRQDRLLEITEHFEEYEIPFTRVQAIENSNGAEGLRDTMLIIFNEAIDNGYNNILVFEDDAKFIMEKQWVDEVMENVIKQLPENYWLCYLGGQPTGGYSNFYSPNLLPAIKYFSTQSVMYSKQGIKEIMARGIGFPIDNWIVDEIQTQGNCYAIDPMLCVQREGFSNIGHAEINWQPFMKPKHDQELNKMRTRC